MIVIIIGILIFIIGKAMEDAGKGTTTTTRMDGTPIEPERGGDDESYTFFTARKLNNYREHNNE